MAKYFGTNGVRGTFDVLTSSLALQLAQAIGIYFKRGKILVARDHRLTSPALSHAVIAGLQSMGCDVIDFGLLPAPVAEWSIQPLQADGLIIITASHNPPEWNGIKVIDGSGITVSRERGEEIEKLMDRVSSVPWNKTGKYVSSTGTMEKYVQAILPLLNVEKIKKRKLKLVLDFGNGTTALTEPLFRSLGCELITLNAQMDGRFPGRPSEPTEKNVQDLIAAVKATQADAGIAWDGDGDRIVFVDEKGSYVIGDKVFGLSILWQFAQKKGDVVTTVATSKIVEDIAKKSNAKLLYTKIGAPYLSETVAKKKAAIAGEEVGGVIWPQVSLAKDGVFTAAKLCEALCEKPLGKWLEELPVYYTEKTKLEANEKQKTKIVQKIRAYAKKKKFKFIDIDGVRINFDDSWVIVRASGTEHYVRVFAEAKTPEKAKQLLSEYKMLAK